MTYLVSVNCNKAAMAILRQVILWIYGYRDIYIYPTTLFPRVPFYTPSYNV